MRVPTPTRDSLPPDAQPIWDRIAGPRGGLHGPYLVLLTVPALADHVAQLGAWLRFHGTLPGHVRELAILAAGRTMNVPFEFVMHQPHALEEGVPPATIQAVADGRFDSLSGNERLIVDIAAALCHDRDLDDALYAAGAAAFGDAAMVELVTLVGFYTAIATIITTFRVPLPDGATNPFAP